MFYVSFPVVCNGRASEGELPAQKGKHLPAMTNGINTKSDVELFLAKEASRRGLRLSDLESTSNTKVTLGTFKDYHTLSSLSKKGSEDHNLNELNKHNLDNEKTVKVYNGRSGLSGIGKSTRKPNGKVNDKVKDYEEEEEDDSDSDSLSASSSSMNGSRKNSRSSSPKVCVISMLCMLGSTATGWTVDPRSVECHSTLDSIDCNWSSFGRA